MWVGGAGTADWSVPANWNPSGVPEAGDEVWFRDVTVSVTPPGAFAGTIVVSNSTVTAVVSDEGTAPTFSIGVFAGAKFVKSGTGDVTLKPRPGYFAGDVEVAAGAVTFSGNGAEAPGGMFGKLVIRNGASARIAGSPFATRHAGFACGGFLANRTTEMTGAEFIEIYKADYATYEKGFAEKTLATDLYCSVYTPALGGNYFTNDQFMPSQLINRDYFMAWVRAIILVETPNQLAYTGLADNCGCHYIDRGSYTVSTWQGPSTFNSTVTPGWHAFDHAAVEGTGTFKVNFTRGRAGDWDDGKFGPDALWFGVCFNSITAESGATLTIPDGQALGIARGDQMSVRNATVTGTGCLSLMGSQAQMDLSTVAGFPGRIELGRGVSAKVGAAAEALKWTVFGAGTLVVRNDSASLLESGFAGTLDIPADVTFSLPPGVVSLQCTGTGTFNLTDEAQMACLRRFTGTVQVDRGLSVGVGSLGFLERTRFVLGDGSSASLGSKLLAGGAYEPILTWNDGPYWSTNAVSGGTKAKASGKPEVLINQGASYVEEGTGDLIITDDPGQFRTVIYTNRTFSASDEWEVSFSLTAEHPSGNKWEEAGYGQGWAEGFSFVIQDTGPTDCPNKNNARPASSYGFFVYTYSQNIQWIADGVSVGPAVGAASAGLTLRGKKIDIHVRCSDALMHVTFSQDGQKKYEAVRDLSPFFAAHASGYLTLAAHSAFWGETNATVPWQQTRISDFSGRCRVGKGTYVEITGDRALSHADQWALKGEAAFDSKSSTLHMAPAKENKWGAANCKMPFASFRVPFRATYAFDAMPPAETGSRAEAVVFALQATGTDAVSKEAYSFGSTASDDTFGVSFYAYNGTKAGIFDKGNWAVSSRSGDTLAFKQKVSGTFDVEYDGAGTISYSAVWTDEAGKRVTSSGTYTATETFARLADKPMYLSFFASEPTWAATCAFDVRDFKLYTYRDANGLVDGPVEVAPGAAAELRLGGYALPDSLSATLSDLKIGSGAALTLSPYESASVLANRVTVNGTASLSVASNAKVTLGGLAFTSASPGTLSVGGEGAFSFADRLTVVIPSSWRSAISGPTTIVDLSGTGSAVTAPTSFELLDENGATLRSPHLVFEGNCIRLEKFGMMILFR